MTLPDFSGLKPKGLTNRSNATQKDFVFQLTKEEAGVSQLSSVVKNTYAAMMSVQIIRAFVAMRRFLVANAGLFQRLEAVEVKQLSTDRQINEILNRLDDGSLKKKLGIFFDNQMFDADVLVEQIVSKAKKRIVLVDDYVTAEILQRFHSYAERADIDCYVKARMKTPTLDRIFVDFKLQYPLQHCELHTFEKSHDRWLIVDDTVYHFGASIKDLGKRWFSVDVNTEYSADDLIARL